MCVHQHQSFLEYIENYKKNSDKADLVNKADKFINGMFGVSYDNFCEYLKKPEVDKDFISILADIKINQVLSADKSSFFYPSRPGLQKLVDRYAFFQASIEDKKEIIKADKIAKESASVSYASGSPEAKKIKFTSRHDKLINEYNSAWVRQLLRCLCADIKNWAKPDILSSTEDLIMDCYYIHSDNSNYNNKLYLTSEYIFAVNLGSRLYGFKELLLKDKDNEKLFAVHQDFLDAIINMLSVYNPNGLLDINKSRLDLEFYASKILNLKQDELAEYLLSSGFLAIKFFYDLFASVIQNPRSLYQGFDLMLLEKLRVSAQNITIYHPESVVVKLLIDYDGFELFTDCYDSLLDQVKLHDFSNLPNSPLKRFLENSIVPYENSKLWESAFSERENFSSKYNMIIEHKQNKNKTIFILLDYSSSMVWASDPGNDDEDLGNISRWIKAKSFVREYLEDLKDLDDNYKVSVILFNDNTSCLSGFDVSLDSLIDDFDELISNFDPSGGTNIEKAFEMVYKQINDYSDFDPSACQIMIVTDDELNHFDENDNLINRYEIKTGFMGVCPAVFAVSVYLNDDPNLVEAGCKNISDTFSQKSPLMKQLLEYIPDINFVFNIHKRDNLNNFLLLLDKTFDNFSLNEMKGVVDIYYAKNSNNDDLEVEEFNYTQIPGYDEGMAGAGAGAGAEVDDFSPVFPDPEFGPDLEAGILVANNEIPSVSLSVKRPFFNWFKRDIFNPWHDFLLYNEMLCVNKYTQKVYLPECVRKIIFSYLSHRKFYVKLDMEIRFNYKNNKDQFPNLGVDLDSGESRDLVKTCLTDKRSNCFRDLQRGLDSFYEYHNSFSSGFYDDLAQHKNTLDKCEGELIEFVYDVTAQTPYAINSWQDESLLWVVNKTNQLNTNFVLLNNVK